MFRLPRMKTFLFLFQGVASRFHFIRNILWAPIIRHKHTAEVIHMSCGHEIELGNTRSPQTPLPLPLTRYPGGRQRLPDGAPFDSDAKRLMECELGFYLDLPKPTQQTRYVDRLSVPFRDRKKNRYPIFREPNKIHFHEIAGGQKKYASKTSTPKNNMPRTFQGRK